MNTDIRLSTEFWGHPKTNKLIKRLGIEGARSLQILWLWAVKNRPDGNLSGMDWEDIEFVADWHGEEMAFFGQCLACSWIDEVDGGYAIHDWAEHNPWQAEAKARSEQARKSAQARWDKQRAKLAHENGKADIVPDKCEGNASAMLAHNFSNAPLLSSPIQNALKDNTTPYGVVVGESSPTPLEVESSGELLLPLPASHEGQGATPEKKEQRQVPNCPHEAIIAAYHEILPELPRVKVWDSARKSHLQARWRERWQAQKYRSQQEGLSYWRRLFTHVHDNCDFLMGRITGSKGKPFRADLAWLVGFENFAKVIEGRYDNRQGEC